MVIESAKDLKNKKAANAALRVVNILICIMYLLIILNIKLELCKILYCKCSFSTMNLLKYKKN